MSAVVPCHHEAPRVDLVSRLLEAVGHVLVVDDGVPVSARSALAGIARRARVDVVTTNGNRGKGHAIATGLRFLLAREPPPDAVLVVDGDGQHPPGAAPAFLAAAAHADLVVGDRFAELAHMPIERRLANRLASRLLARATSAHVRDSQCGMRLLRGRALHEVPFEGGGYEAEARHLKRCLRAGVRVVWVPIPAIYEGELSSFQWLRDTLRVARALVR